MRWWSNKRPRQQHHQILYNEKGYLLNFNQNSSTWQHLQNHLLSALMRIHKVLKNKIENSISHTFIVWVGLEMKIETNMFFGWYLHITEMLHPVSSHSSVKMKENSNTANIIFAERSFFVDCTSSYNCKH